MNFCELRHNSCEECVQNNENPVFLTHCYWYNNTCLAEKQLDQKSARIHSLEMCRPKNDIIFPITVPEDEILKLTYSSSTSTQSLATLPVSSSSDTTLSSSDTSSSSSTIKIKYSKS
jgi:hypothetical protein